MALSVTVIIVLAVILGVVLTGNDTNDASEPITEAPMPTVADWAGSYTGQALFGATSGTWGNGGVFPLVINSDGQVSVRGEPIVSFEYDVSEKTLQWFIEDGNDTNGNIAFQKTYTSDFYFSDFNDSTVGQSFTGAIQRGGEGALDYRGVLC